MTRTSPRRTGGGRTVRKAQKNNTPLLIGGGVVLLLIVAAAVFSFTRNNGASIGEKIPDIGPSLHLQTPNDVLPVAYNSDPPTSGYHWGGGIGPWGVQTKPISDTITVHNLEHGGVIIHYSSSLDATTVGQLSDLTRDLQRQNPCIILEPRDGLANPITVTAWAYMLKLDKYDPATIQAFFKARVGRGPEAVCRPMS